MVEFNLPSFLVEVGSLSLSYIQLKIFHKTCRNFMSLEIPLIYKS